MRLTYRQYVLLVGALVGGVVGALLALLYLDRTDETESQGPNIGWREISQVAVALGTLVRQLNRLAENAEEK